MKIMAFKRLPIFLLYLTIFLMSYNPSAAAKSDELDINIDVNNLVAEFDERINFSLKVKDNNLNVQKIEKFLPDLEDNSFFGLNVTSEKADIKKFDIVEIADEHNPAKKKKILLIEYKLKKNAIINFDSNTSGKDYNNITDIDFCICFKTKDFQVVKNKIFLRDVAFDNNDINDENLTLKINLYNLPQNASINNVNIAKTEINKSFGKNNNHVNVNVDASHSNNNRYNGANNNNNNKIKRNFNSVDNSIDFNYRNSGIGNINSGDSSAQPRKYGFNTNIDRNTKSVSENKPSDNKYTMKYQEKFHKDSITFLSLNVTLLNSSDFNIINRNIRNINSTNNNIYTISTLENKPFFENILNTINTTDFDLKKNKKKYINQAILKNKTEYSLTENIIQTRESKEKIQKKLRDLLVTENKLNKGILYNLYNIYCFFIY